MPAICATPIRGIARKLRPRPANVTRENASAPTGNSTASAAAEAANIANSSRPITTIDAETGEAARSFLVSAL